MNKIIASRGMGKTTKLINEAKLAIKNGKKVIFISNSSVWDKVHTECPKVETMSLKDVPFKLHGRCFQDTVILIDELDLQVAGLLGANFTYTLTIGD